MKSGGERPRNRSNLDRREFFKDAGKAVAGLVAGGVIWRLFDDALEEGHRKEGLKPDSDNALLNETLTKLTKEEMKRYLRNDFQIRLLESLNNEKDLKDISEKKDRIGELTSKINQRLDRAGKLAPEVNAIVMESKDSTISWFSGFAKENDIFKNGNIVDAADALKKEIERQVGFLRDTQDSILKKSPINPPDRISQ